MKKTTLPPVINDFTRRLWAPSRFSSVRCLHSTIRNPATVNPITGTGPPPPVPKGFPEAPDHVAAKTERKRRAAEMMEKAAALRAAEGDKKSNAAAAANSTGGIGVGKRQRFWKHVYVKEADDGLQIFLDTRPVRRLDKRIITIPKTKPHLATALALEWDLILSNQEAMRPHLIPLTSLITRALDIIDEDKGDGQRIAATDEEAEVSPPIRESITTTVMRYLDTDSLLCWAPEPPADPPGYERHESRVESLRSIQGRTAKPIISYLTTRVWPGIEINPVLESDSIVPQSQPQLTRDVIKGWVTGLPAFELAGLERAVLAGKGLLGAVRLVVEWSDQLAHLREGSGPERFGVEEAAKVASLEVDWQTGMWGAVEDTHDVEHEDIRRQLGSVVLLVSGLK